MSNLRMKPLVAAIALTTGASTLAQTDPSMDSLEEIVVTGSFRDSLANALNAKRDAANNIDSIMAEDMGKMPDLNLAESLQRVPGVAITREGGEGRQITVRGLGPDFTRSTLNGMEVPGSASGLDSSGSINRGRAMDFNIFASEIFSRIDLHKSPIASVEEGGLASTVEMHTAKPFDNPGFNATVSGQLTVDNISGEDDPRISGLVSNTFMDDTLGVLVSFAHSTRTVQQEGFGSVRWASPFQNGDRSWGGTEDPEINGTPNPSANHPEFEQGDDPLDYMWAPRLPRMDLFMNEQDRTGATAAVQFRPNDRLELGLDVVASKLENDRRSYNYFHQFRNEWDKSAPISVTLDPEGRYIQAGEFNLLPNPEEDGLYTAAPRSESRGQFSETEFLQTVFSGSYDLTDNTQLRFLAGNANSEHDEEQYRYNMTAENISADEATFSYDFSANPDIAEMSYGFDPLDHTNYNFTGPVIRKDIIERDNTTIRFDVETDHGSSVTRFGVIYNDREVDSLRHDPTEGTLTPPDTVTDELTSGIPVSDYASEIDAPAGFPRNWLVADFDATNEAYGAGDFTAVPLDSTSWNVQEETTGAYGAFDVHTELLGQPLLINAGVRVVQTETTATAAAATIDPNSDPEDPQPGEPQTFSETNTYTDVLPSTNIVWEIREDLVWRTNVARNLTRPGLGSLAPTTTNIGTLAGSVSTGNPNLDPIRANSIDTGLEWYFAEESVLSATYFRKDIESFINGSIVEGQLSNELQAIVSARPEYDPDSPLYEPSAVVPSSSDWEVSQPVNSDGAKLDGVEFAYQQPFYFLPAPFNNLGAVANYNIVDSHLEQGDFDSALSGLSRNSYNFSLYYETDTYGVRASANGRDDYVTDVPGGSGNAEAKTTGPTRVDVSAFYDVTDNIRITLEAINVTNEKERLYVTGPVGDLNLVREYNTTGREVLLGLRASF